MKDREDGWYWVLLSECSEWECSKYEGDQFYLPHWGWHDESDLLEVGDMVSRETKRAVNDFKDSLSEEELNEYCNKLKQIAAMNWGAVKDEG